VLVDHVKVVSPISDTNTQASALLTDREGRCATLCAPKMRLSIHPLPRIRRGVSMATKIDPYSIGFAYNDLAVEITPEEAAALLELNVEGNRDLREPAVDRLVADIEAGTYLPSGSTIGIS